MKKFTLLMMAFAIAVSCSKEEETLTNPSLKNGEVDYDPTLWENTSFTLGCGNLINSLTVSNGKLVFTDNQHFLDLRQCLEDEQDRYLALFDATYPNRTDDEIEVIEEGVGFDENDVLYMFLDNLPGFNSLFEKIDGEELTWLANGDTAAPDPDDHSVIDIFERVFLNENSEVKISSESYDFATLSGINYLAKTNTANCREGVSRTRWKYSSSGSRAAKVKVGIGWRPWGSEVVAKTKSYKRKKGKYKKYRTTISARVQGEVSALGDDCESFFLFAYKYDSKKGKSVVARRVIGGQFFYETSKYKMNGYHTCSSFNLSYLGWLNW